MTQRTGPATHADPSTRTPEPDDRSLPADTATDTAPAADTEFGTDPETADGLRRLAAAQNHFDAAAATLGGE
ncbi:MAG: hypothetical protein AAFO91_01845 [Bacteroidota bacterium]